MANPIYVVVVGPVMTNEQITDAFEFWLGRPPRRADLAVCDMLGRLPDAVAEFIWNHGLNQPLIPTPNTVHEWIYKEFIA